MRESTLKETEHLFEKIIKNLFRGEMTTGFDIKPDMEEQLFLWLQANGFTPLFLYHFPGEQLTAWFSSNFVDQLRTQAKQEVVIELESTLALRKILESFDEHAIDFILMKGTALSHRHYPKAGLRPRSDTDLIIRGDHFEDVCNILDEAGYSLPYENSGDLVNNTRVYSRPLRFELDHVLDLHSSVTSTHGLYRESLDFSTIQGASIDLPDLAPNASCMGDSHALLHACFHAAQHYSHLGERLIWIYDIYLLLQHISATNLTATLEFAESVDMLGLLAHGINRSNYWFNSEIPKVLTETLAAYAGDSSLEVLETNLEKGIAIRAYANMKNIKGIRNKMLYLWQRLFPPPQYLLQISHHENPLWLPLLYCQRILAAAKLVLSKLALSKKGDTRSK